MSSRKSRKRKNVEESSAWSAEDDECEEEEGGVAAHSVPTAYAPAYKLGSSKKRQCFPVDGRTESGVSGRGPQCSEHPDQFCFFCAYERDPNSESGTSADLYGSLVDLVESMQRQKKEFPAIVDAVSVAYEGQIRPHVHDVDFGKAPEWTTASIERHLTFSNQFGQVFDSAVTQVFHALISRQNDCVMDATTGHVIEENRSALMNTLDHYMKWQRHQRTSASAGAAKRK